MFITSRSTNTNRKISDTWHANNIIVTRFTIIKKMISLLGTMKSPFSFINLMRLTWHVFDGSKLDKIPLPIDGLGY